MKIVIAPDSFKESLTAAEAAAAMQRGFAQVFPDAEYVMVPMADGGEGTSDALVQALHGDWVNITVEGPLGEVVQARYGYLNEDTAVIEMAAAAGLDKLTPEQRNPMLTSTYGVGQMMADALARGVRHIILGIGGSATNDGGAGMAQALGFRLLDKQGQQLAQGGAALAQLVAVESHHVLPALANCRIEVACDVTNPLCGAQGASAVYAPQKGADAAMAAQLDAALTHFADVLAAHGYADCRDKVGSGAAGGLGFGLMALCAAELKSGVDIVINEVRLADKIRGADWVLTGEGRMDGQTAFGKVPAGVLKVAQAEGVPVIGLVGCLGEDVEGINHLGFAAVLPTLSRPDSLPKILANGANEVERTAVQVASLLALGLNSAQSG